MLYCWTVRRGSQNGEGILEDLLSILCASKHVLSLTMLSNLKYQEVYRKLGVTLYNQQKHTTNAFILKRL